MLVKCNIITHISINSNVLMCFQIISISEKVEHLPFMYLTCDLPPPPLYPDDARENIIPQVPIFQILNKFNGTLEKEYKTYKDSTLKKFEITRLPPYIILYIKVSSSIEDCLPYVLLSVPCMYTCTCMH